MSAQTDKARMALELISTAVDRGFTLDYAMGVAQAALSELEAQPSEPRLTVDQIMEFVKKWIAEMQPDSPIDPDEWNQPEWIKQESILRDRLTKAAQWP